MKRLAATLAILGILAPLTPAAAFDPNYIISDEEMTNRNAMTRDQIQEFLEKGYLASYQTTDWEGVTRSASDIIYRAAQDHGISPKFLLVLLQKEQSLIEDDEPTQKQLDWATGYAVCDYCSMSDPRIQRWKGFGKQVNSAALQFIEGYLADIEEQGYTVGKYGPDMPVEIDDVEVIPANAATAAMYAYTPHFQGNENFTRIWDNWFGSAAEYPTGTLLQAAGQEGVYLIQYGYKRPITSRSALVSRFNADMVIQVSSDALALYPTGNPISFPNYSLLKDDDGNIYLLVDDSLRHITSMEVFRKIGFVEDQVVAISNEDVTEYDKGNPITEQTLYPIGSLMQISGGSLFYVRDGMRHLIVDDIIRKEKFANVAITKVDAATLEQYREGKPVKLPDGYLVKSANDPRVYVISDGERRAIDSENTFLAFGWSWGNIITVSEDALEVHPVGEDISITE